METSDGKQAEKGLKRPKRSKNEAKKRSSAVWEHRTFSGGRFEKARKTAKNGEKTRKREF